jgi:transcriptional regulator with XRE-family HTH domain
VPAWESLKAFRKECGLTIEALAQQLDLPSDYVSRIENGQDGSVTRFMWKLKTVYPEIDANAFLREMNIAWVEVAIDRKTKEVISTTPATVDINLDLMPKHELDSLCRVILRGARKAFENPQFRADYEVWLAERKARQAAGESL